MHKGHQRLHGLECFMERNEQPISPSSGVQAKILRNRSYVNVRGNPADPALMERFESALGQPLPKKPNTTSIGQHTIYWLGPDEWMICGVFDDAAALIERLQTELDNEHVAINDLSGGMLTIRLSGTGTHRLLSKGCTLDFHPESFAPGACAQSGLAKANVLIGYAKDGSAFEVIVRRSFADYLAQWMHKACQSEGIEFL